MKLYVCLEISFPLLSSLTVLRNLGRMLRRSGYQLQLQVSDPGYQLFDKQGGGADAFSGISGNPLASWAARELIRSGGAANLAETDELVGAEPYVLQNVRDLETAQRFLLMVERFKERVGWHGTSVEGNPSGGNKLSGLFNLTVKSLGAAMITANPSGSRATTSWTAPETIWRASPARWRPAATSSTS